MKDPRRVVPALEPMLYRPTDGLGSPQHTSNCPPTDDENILDHWSLLSSQDIDRDYVGMLAASMMADEFFRYSESDEI